GELVPLLSWCRRFHVDAECHLRGRGLALELSSGDPIFPAIEPRQYDSRLEQRFAREFARLAPHLDIVREPPPLAAARTLILPDFALQHRTEPSRRWLLEIVGFWTPDYLRTKLRRYRDARLANLVLCVDDERCCAAEELPSEARIVRFRRRVDASAVLRA